MLGAIRCIRGCRGVRVVLGAGRECRGYWGHYGGTRGARSVLGAGRDCRDSGARRGIGGIRGYWELLGSVWGVGSC